MVDPSSPITDSIPVIDLSNPNESQVAQELTDALRRIGFATLVHHGVAPATIANGFAASQSFFELPLETKLQYKYKSHTANRGYISMGSEKFASLTRPDHKETFDIGKEGEEGFETPWPVELQDQSFKESMLTYFQEFDALNLRLVRWIAMGLGLEDEDFFVDRCNEQHCNLRVLHYPELQRLSEETIVRGAIHTDYGSITLLAQDAIGGLRAQRLDKSWINVKPVEGSIIVNVGDMFQRWTNDALIATPHQVVDLPTHVDIIPERYSIAFFCNVNKSVVLDPATLVLKEQDGETPQPSKYEPMTALDYIVSRLSQTIASSSSV